jgi:uncharacterized phage protein (TIGR02220 family)
VKNYELLIKLVGCIAENLSFILTIEEDRIIITKSGVGNTKTPPIHIGIIEYLNQKTGKQYKPSSKQTQKLINARVKEHSATLEDFKYIIDIKCAEWKGQKMEQYLKPSTLFAASHFEDYLNQKPEENRLLSILTKDDWND